MSRPEWNQFPDKHAEGVYWVRWRARYRVNRWHATLDGGTTLCGLGVIDYLLYVGRQFYGCQHCLKAVRKDHDPAGGLIERPRRS